MNTLTMPATLNEPTIAEEIGYCPSSFCGEAWLITPHPAQPELWQLASIADGGQWQIAATRPVCPLCGATLLMAQPQAQLQPARAAALAL